MLWNDVLGVFVTRSCQIGNELIVIFEVGESTDKDGMGVGLLDEGFEEVIAAAERYLTKCPIDWKGAIQNAQRS